MLSQDLVDRLRAVLEAAEVDPERTESVLLAVQMTWALMRFDPGDGAEELSALASIAAGVLEAERIVAGTPPVPWERSTVKLRLVEGGRT
jgi:hypothetical protein